MIVSESVTLEKLEIQMSCFFGVFLMVGWTPTKFQALIQTLENPKTNKTVSTYMEFAVFWRR